MVIAGAAALVITGGAAYAYWTQGGSGTGTAATGTTTGVTVNQTSTIINLAPGVAAQTLSGNFDNPNSGPAYVTSVTVAISSVVKAGGAPTGTCEATDYTLAGSAPVNAEVAAGNAKGTWTGLTIAFNNKGSVQDACKNATVNLAYTAS